MTRIRKTCPACNVTFITARCHQLYADHSWTHPELVEAAGLDPKVWCTA